jgi:hypothetical protein
MMWRLQSVLLLLALTAAPWLRAQDGGLAAAQPPLAAAEVVERLVRANAERAGRLKRVEGTRTYRLVYKGFPGDRQAEMVVTAVFDSPSSKEFKIVSASGSKLIQDRVFRRLMQSEQEALQPEVQRRNALDTTNYDFSLAGYEPAPNGARYILEVKPKTRSKFLYAGRIWVDAEDFAVIRIEAEPAKSPSFWTKRNQIQHEYAKVDGFWLPAHNLSISSIRLGGKATLTIEYTDYKVTAQPSAAPAASRD